MITASRWARIPRRFSSPHHCRWAFWRARTSLAAQIPRVEGRVDRFARTTRGQRDRARRRRDDRHGFDAFGRDRSLHHRIACVRSNTTSPRRLPACLARPRHRRSATSRQPSTSHARQRGQRNACGVRVANRSAAVTYRRQRDRDQRCGIGVAPDHVAWRCAVTVPGFMVARSGGPGTLTSLFPRGGESDFTLVLVDGIRVNSFGGGLDLSQVPLADIDRIEVVRGPQSAIHGADAIGGVVQVITRTGGPYLRALESRAAAAPLAASSHRPPANSTPGAGRAAAIIFRRWLHGHRASERRNRVERRCARAAGMGRCGLARTTEAPTSRGHSATSTPSAVRLGRTDRTRRTASAASIGSRVARPNGTRSESEALHPWGGPSSRVRQRVEFDVADYDLRFVDAVRSIRVGYSSRPRDESRRTAW